MYMSDFEPGLESSNRGFQCILELPELQKFNYVIFGSDDFLQIIRVSLSDLFEASKDMFDVLNLQPSKNNMLSFEIEIFFLFHKSNKV